MQGDKSVVAILNEVLTSELTSMQRAVITVVSYLIAD